MNWGALTEKEHNLAVATCLRGLAELIESSDKKARIKIGAKVIWSDSNDKIETGIMSLPAFVERVNSYITQKTIQIIREKNVPNADELIEALEARTRVTDP